MAEAVKVAVRVRPFNQREIDRKSKLIIKMRGNTTTITDPEDGKERDYTFDYSYWSHDGFKETESGYLVKDKESSPYADQTKVFTDLGEAIIKNAWEGYNSSLFAYGQTGSGKSYSVVGYGCNKGIVPVYCDTLFQRITAAREKEGFNKEQEDFSVKVSMIEIYNEQVKDLFNVKSFKKGGLKVRQSKDGFIVQNLKICEVGSYEEIDSLIQKGTEERTVAATNMNASSSRAHTVVTIYFSQKTYSEDLGQSMTKQAQIALVDLAGSERAESTGATGDRLKEGAAINQSLSCLGNVISALADISNGKKVVVPYRDSKLTQLLKNALGGNSKTIMVAALSPADINHDETLGTLRYADRAKQIKTQATVNESATDKLIRELKEEIDALRTGGATVGGAVNSGMSKEEEEAQMAAMDAALAEKDAELANMQKSWEEKMESQQASLEARLQEVQEQEIMKQSTPHLWNLNEDPMLTGKVVLFCYDGSTNFGSDDICENTILGAGIMGKHAVIKNKNDQKIVIEALEGLVLVNGKEIEGETEVFHNDRITFSGSSHLYCVHHPQDAKNRGNKGESTDSVTVSYQTAKEEIAKEKGFDIEKAKLCKDFELLEDLNTLPPQVEELNNISDELDKKIHFEIIMITPEKRGEVGGNTKVEVKVNNLVDKTVFYWDKNTFQSRRFEIQDMYNNFKMKDKNWDLVQEKDPFYQNPETTKTVIGVATFYCENILNKIDMEDEKYFITDLKGQNVTEMVVGSYPINNSGKIDREGLIEDPSELLNAKLDFEINVQKIDGLSSRFKNVWVEYAFNGKKFVSPPAYNQSRNFRLGYKAQIHWDKVTDTELTELGKGIFTTIYSNQIPVKEGRVERSKTPTADLRTEYIQQSCLDRLTSQVELNPGTNNTQQIKEIIKEVPVEVIKEIIREVEVIKEVQVIKEVPLGAGEVREVMIKDERITMFEQLVEKANAQGKKTVLVSRVQCILDGERTLPAKLESDFKIVQQKSSSCEIM